MNLDDLRRRRATLETLRLDLAKWGFGEPAESAPCEIPIVAIDWSEIFCYVMYQPLREEENEDLFAAHYAGLEYLLLKLRCKPVLLPPYAAEMKDFIEMVQTKVIAPGLTRDVKELGDKYKDLARSIQKLQKRYPAFDKVVNGTWSAAEQLDQTAWDFLEKLLKEELPTIYFDFQQTTLEAIQALTALLGLSDSAGAKRISFIDALKILPDRACERSLRGWLDWKAEMDQQRAHSERQNRADAMALAYLQALHQASFWKDVPVYFASRSLAMLQVMENHAGEFEPYRRADSQGSSTASVDAQHAIQSSWRSWEYFAELGYYAGEFGASGNAIAQSRCAEIAVDLIDRTAKLTRSIGRESHGDKKEAKASFADWATIRGSFDLKDMGEKNHWKRIRIRQPRIARLVDLLKFVLSAESPEAFVVKRGEMARNILVRIDSILASLPLDIQLERSVPNIEDDASASLTLIVRENIDIPALFGDYMERIAEGSDAGLNQSVFALLKAAVDALNSPQAMDYGRELLRSMAEPTGSLSAAPRDWLIGVAYFLRTAFDDCLKYLPSWLEINGGTAQPALGLVTRALCADAYRLCGRRRYDEGMQLLLDAGAGTGLSPTETIVWHCIKGQLLLEWLAEAKEQYHMYPFRNGETAVLVPMLNPAAKFVAEHAASHHSLCMRVADNVLMLAGRYVPADLSYDESEQKRKPDWLSDPNQQELEQMEGWFREQTEMERSARYLHTLGYYHVKMALVDRGSLDDGIRFLEEAEQLAHRNGDRKTEGRVAGHLDHARAWASGTFGARR